MKNRKDKKVQPASDIRKLYIIKLVGRCIICCLCGMMYIADRESFEIMNGLNFFKRFSPFHIIWAIWMADMLLQIVPVKNRIPLGSQKLFRLRFRPIREKVNVQRLKQYIVSTTKSAYKVFVLWTALIIVLGVLYTHQIIDDALLFMITVVFYVCDLICVLVWCPFRLIMQNRCCTTCRIFNWDHLMMFSPQLFVKGFFSYSLFLMSIVVWIVWELCVLLHPERFWEYSNEALKCENCTDKLCTQYCRKLRSPNGAD